MTHYKLVPATQTCDIYVDGLIVESVPMSAGLDYRTKRLAHWGRQPVKPLSRTAGRRLEQGQRVQGGVGYSRSGRR
jgi:hypothetical protein